MSAISLISLNPSAQIIKILSRTTSGGYSKWMMGGPLKVWVGWNNSYHPMFFNRFLIWKKKKKTDWSLRCTINTFQKTPCSQIVNANIS